MLYEYVNKCIQKLYELSSDLHDIRWFLLEGESKGNLQVNDLSPHDSYLVPEI